MKYEIEETKNNITYAKTHFVVMECLRSGINIITKASQPVQQNLNSWVQNAAL